MCLFHEDKSIPLSNKSIRQEWSNAINNLVLTDLFFPGGSEVKNPPAVQETQVQSLGQEDSRVGNGNPVFLPGKSHGQRSLVCLMDI